MRERQLIKALYEGAFDERLRTVYGGQPLAALYERIESVAAGFSQHFDPMHERDLVLFSSPGRTELGGNHTDHQGGCGICAAVGMDTLGCAARSESNTIRVKSRNHRMAIVSLEDLAVREEEKSSSPALVRGMAYRLGELGYTVGGFDVYTETSLIRASGLSSSAAFEVLFGTICNHLFCEGDLSDVELAQLAQWAENRYYGKPCGLMDALTVACGGVIFADFGESERPFVRRCESDLDAAHTALVIIDSGKGHGQLDELFAEIPREMEAVAQFFGKKKLGQVDREAFFARRAEVEHACGGRAASRAEHFYAEAGRAEKQYKALVDGDHAEFLRLSRESGQSCEEKLQNVRHDGRNGDHLAHVIERARTLAGENGAARVHGGGFAGTVQAYVPRERLEGFIAGMEEMLGASCCHVVQLRSAGACRLF